MLYLLKSGNYYKIGYTDNIEKRMNSYKTHNPEYTLIGIKSGDRNDEYNYHLRYKEYLVQGEWMNLSDELINNIKKEFNRVTTIEMESIYLSLEGINSLLDLRGKEIKILMACWRYSCFNSKGDNKGNLFYNNLDFKEFVRNDGINSLDSNIDYYISKLHEKGFLIKEDKGVYMLNPRYFFKGSYKDAVRLSSKIEIDNNKL